MFRSLNFSALSCVMIFWSAPSLAACVNYLDGSLGDTPAPKYRICYDDVCDLTQLIYQCANTHDYKEGFAIGWQRSCLVGDEDAEDCTIFWQGRRIDPEKYHRLKIEALEPIGQQ